MLVALLCMLAFFLFAGLIYTGRLPALLALPIMAAAIALIGGIPGNEILGEVLGKGALKLNGAMTTAMFGAMLAQLLNRAGISLQLIRWTAEHAGDNPFLLGLCLTGLTALLFTTLGGLGTVIMLGSVVLPVMTSVGIPAATAGGLFLMGISLGGLFNLGNWQLYIDVLKLPQSAIMGFALPLGGIAVLSLVLFLTWELRRQGRKILPGLGIAFLGAAALLLLRTVSIPISSLHHEALKPYLLGGFWALTSLAFLQRLHDPQSPHRWYALLTPFVPLLMVLGFGWDIIPSFIGGLLYGTLTTWRKGGVNALVQSIFEGVSAVAPAVVLIMGIGMLLAAVMHPKVSAALSPLLAHFIPGRALPFVLLFALISPLTLYRGPLSLWGMGSGLVGIVLGGGLLPAGALMGMLLSVGQIQGICDPTNTQNVWVANYLSISTGELLRKTILFAWLSAVAGLLLTAARYLPW